MAGFGSCQTRRRLRGLGIAFCHALPAAALLALAASRAFPGAFARAARQHHYFRTDRFCDCIQFRFTDVDLEEFQVTAFYSNNRETWKTFPFTDTSTLAHKDLCHRKLLSRIMGICP